MASPRLAETCRPRSGGSDKLLPFSSVSHFVKVGQPVRILRQPGVGICGIEMMSTEFTIW
jgi:hypothetical protein